MRRLLVRWMSLNPSRRFLHDWLATAARGRNADFRVLDAGAGGTPYRSLFADVTYETADFGAVDKEYGDLDYVCDLSEIPVETGRYDLIVCTQVFEHLPDPIKVLNEFRRILKPDGQVWLSAPLFYEEHETPYDFHRYTRYAWEHMAGATGFIVEEIEWLEGYYTTLSYQLAMAANELPRRMLLFKVLFALLAGWFARLDLRHPATGRGMPKNYRVVMSPDRIWTGASASVG